MANGQTPMRSSRQNRPQRVERPPVRGGGGGPPRRAMGGGGGAPQGKAPARPPAPQQRQPQGAPPRGMPQGGGRGAGRGAGAEREAKDMAISRTSEATGMPPEALQSFTLLELQVLPSILQKMEGLAGGEPSAPTAPPQGGRGSGGPSAPKGQSMRPPSRQQANDEFAREIPMKSPARGRQPVMR